MEEQKSLHNKRYVGLQGDHYKTLQKATKEGLIHGVYHIHEQEHRSGIQLIFMNGNAKIAILPKSINKFNARPIKIPTGFGQGAEKLVD